MTICRYCMAEVREREIEAEDGCCPECGALLSAGGGYLGDEEGYDDIDELEDDELIKLELRNIDDVKFYIGWTLREVFHAKISKQNIVQFFDSTDKTKVSIDKLNPQYPLI